MIKKTNQAVMHAYLKYLYTDEVDDLSPTLFLQLLELTQKYHDQRLTVICEFHLKKKYLNINSVAELYAKSIQFGAQKLKQYCVNFMVNNLTAVINSSSFAQLPDFAFKEIMLAASQSGLIQT